MSALGPIDPSSVQQEDQIEAAWIVRKLAGVNKPSSSPPECILAYAHSQ